MYEEIAFWSMVAALVLALCLPAIRIHARRKHNLILKNPNPHPTAEKSKRVQKS